MKIELELGDGSTSVKEPKLCKIPMLAMVQPDFNSDSVKISVGLDIIIFVGLEIVHVMGPWGSPQLIYSSTPKKLQLLVYGLQVLIAVNNLIKTTNDRCTSPLTSGSLRERGSSTNPSRPCQNETRDLRDATT